MTVIFFISTILFFLGLDWVVRRVKKDSTEQTAAVPRVVSPAYPLRTPEGIFFAKSHTWLNLFPSGKIRLGVDDFVGSLMENSRVTLLKKTGEAFEKGDPLLTLEEGAHSVTVRAPIAGTIFSVNTALAESPDKMREKLFSEGWAYTIRPNALQELKEMLIGGESRSFLFEEFGRLRAFLTNTADGALAPAMIQDGGTPTAGVLKQLDSGKLRQFEEEFLQVR